MRIQNSGFTLMELLIVVVIVGVLSSLAWPNYERSIEKARATEAMNIIKSANDGVYAYAAERNACPPNFNKLLVNIPGAKNGDATEVEGRYFIYKLNAARNALVPGTACGGVVAERIGGGYTIWNPYKVIDADSRRRTLACTATVGTKGYNICQSLGIYTSELPN